MIDLTKTKKESFKDKIDLINNGLLEDSSYYIQVLIDNVKGNKIKLNDDNYYQL